MTTLNTEQKKHLARMQKIACVEINRAIRHEAKNIRVQTREVKRLGKKLEKAQVALRNHEIKTAFFK